MSPLVVAVLYLAGLGLLIADIFLGSVALGVVGVVALGASIFGAFVAGGPFAGGGLVLLTGAATWIAFTVSAKRLAHEGALAPEDGYVSHPSPPTDLVGQRGTAETLLRPAGYARIGGKRVDVVTRGESVEVGTTVEVIQVEGSRVVVKASVSS
jgi:membrane-bound serine protease (ClpP class)